ncbi:MAG: low molecular weight protein arginine phosphatase [Elusimicrobiota bacterium]
MKKITFVCTGNTCRSVMAEKILSGYLEKNNIKEVEVDSAGTAAYPHYAIVGDLKKVMDKKGIDYSGHMAENISRDLIESSDLILAMTSDHINTIRARFDVQQDKLYLLSYYAEGVYEDIPDPIGKGRAAYEETYEVIKNYIEKITEKIKNEIKKK